MSEFGGLRKHEKTPHALVGLGSAALEAVVALPRKGGPNFQKGVIKCLKHCFSSSSSSIGSSRSSVVSSIEEINQIDI